MDVLEALERRFTCRAYLPTPVPRAVVEEILQGARHAPSGGNLQPWRVWAVAGADLEALKAKIRARTQAGQLFESQGEFPMFPDPLKEPYASRHFRNGLAYYQAVGVRPGDWAVHARLVAQNYELFGAPVGLFLGIDRNMLPPQWADLGIFLQSILLLAKSRGLDSAALESWSLWPHTVREHLGAPDEFFVFCAVALGYADPTARANAFRAERAALDEFAVLRGFEAGAAAEAPEGGGSARL